MAPTSPDVHFGANEAPLPGAALLLWGAAPGAIAQLAERLHGMQEVGGSNPPGSTGKVPRQRGFFFSSEAVENGRRSQVERSQLEFGYVWGSWMASKPTVRWNESAGRWMAWVRFPDGSRRKVERVDKAAAQRDLDELLALRAQALEPPSPPAAGGVIRAGDRRLARGRLPDRLADEHVTPCPGEVAEHHRQRPLSSRRPRAPGHRPALGGPDGARPTGGALRWHGARGLTRRAPSTGRGST